MMDLQRLVDAMNTDGQRTRGQYQMTLGQLLAALATAPDDMPVVYADGAGLGNEGSYRGYYCDLAFADSPPRAVEKVRDQVAAAIGKTYEGYKGGNYTMTPATPIWRAEYGSASSIAIMDATVLPDRVLLTTKQIEGGW